VLLAGPYAYKIKKPVDLGFLDFSTLQARRHYCDEEVRLNRRLAPDLYLDCVPVLGSVTEPRIGPPGPSARRGALEFAVRMRRFETGHELGVLAEHGNLAPAVLLKLAQRLADFHRQAARAGTADDWGKPWQVLDPAIANFDQLGELLAGAAILERLVPLRSWTEQEHARLQETFENRRRAGFIRECHGDLHLANIALIQGEPIPFDALEFDPALRWIDTISEIAFTVMDLRQRGLSGQAQLFLDEYLAATGDYDGVRLLPFYLVYRAMVRAKIAAIRLLQPGEPEQREQAQQSLLSHIDLAEQFSAPAQPWLVLTHGVSGCGKSVASAGLLELGDWIRLRSDVERKRLAGPGPLERPDSEAGQGLYTPRMTSKTYRHLREQARMLLQSGHPVIVDATFLSRGQREPFETLARGLRVGLSILAPEAEPETLHARIKSRLVSRADPSDADATVLAAQLESIEGLTAREQSVCVQFDSNDSLAMQHALERIEQLRLAAVRTGRKS
jgi:aminoglycoside phosphotransferase family enzyme/predicted kinase